jgi:NAD(P)-dependent dehydrogenase (short-subunit alcohol dehydrogenase family)
MGSLDESAGIVTGAGRGIGRGIAHALAREGMSLVLVDLDAGTVQATAGEVERLGGSAVTVIGSVADQETASAAALAAATAFGRLDALVNNAQALRSGVPFEQHTDDDFGMALSSGLWGTFRMMRACFPALAERGGAIVNIASSAGTHGLPGFAGYAAAKEGIRGLTKVAANEWGAHGIRVNTICPQAATPISDAYFAQHPERREAKLAQRPIKRDGDAEKDIGRAVVYLAGPDAGFITGATLMVNGGLTIMP